jgi:hypothetical protein
MQILAAINSISILDTSFKNFLNGNFEQINKNVIILCRLSFEFPLRLSATVLLHFTSPLKLEFAEELFTE